MKSYPVFISYSSDSLEHVSLVKDLYKTLHHAGIDARVDFEMEAGQDIGTLRQDRETWIRQQIEDAQVVIIVLSPKYISRWIDDERSGTGQGVKWEKQILSEFMPGSGGWEHKLILPVWLDEPLIELLPSDLAALTSPQKVSDPSYLVALITTYRRASPAMAAMPEGAPAVSMPAEAPMAGVPVDDRLRASEDYLKAATLARTGPETTQFTLFHKPYFVLGEHSPLLAYIHMASAFADVGRDADVLLNGRKSTYSQRQGTAIQQIAPGTVVTIVPYLAHAQIEPKSTMVIWKGPLCRARFDISVGGDAPTGHVGGSVGFYVGPLLVGSVGMDVIYTDPALQVECDPSPNTSEIFKAIFVSYSHEDERIVSDLGRAYEAVGIDYLRDVKKLRSGEKWDERLLQFIDSADVFQLLWSKCARTSPYVEREWRHAWARHRPRFIRPVYWEDPMPAPPAELSDLHFAFLETPEGFMHRFMRRLGLR
jgi:hypothetical protein